VRVVEMEGLIVVPVIALAALAVQRAAAMAGKPSSEMDSK